MIGETTYFTEGGLGKLTPIPPAGVQFIVEYEIRFDCLPNETLGSGLASAGKSRTSMSLKPVVPVFDESLLPEGKYHLRTERDTLRIQKLGGSWELLAAK